MVRQPMKSLGFSLYRSKLNLAIPLLLGRLKLGSPLLCVHICPFSSTISRVLAGRDWKKACVSTTVPSSSSTSVRNWNTTSKLFAAFSRSSSSEEAITVLLRQRLWVQTLKRRG
uniref:Uncharacterized protein n=1 Tax=Anguilla anguilla TaxID=7936 RepID=A0A0E9XHZ5_ANGAN